MSYIYILLLKFFFKALIPTEDKDSNIHIKKKQYIVMLS